MTLLYFFNVISLFTGTTTYEDKTCKCIIERLKTSVLKKKQNTLFTLKETSNLEIVCIRTVKLL